MNYSIGDALLAYAYKRRELSTSAERGIAAFVSGYYDNYSDARELSADALRQLITLYEGEAALDVDVLLTVRNAEASINAYGGILSDTDNTTHPVHTAQAWDWARDNCTDEELV